MSCITVKLLCSALMRDMLIKNAAVNGTLNEQVRHTGATMKIEKAVSWSEITVFSFVKGLAI